MILKLSKVREFMKRLVHHIGLELSVIVFLLASFGQTNPYPEVHAATEKISAQNVGELQTLDSEDLASINELAWSDDESRLAIATQDGVWLYNVATGTAEQIGEKEFAGNVSFLGNTTKIAINYNNRAIIFDTDTLSQTRQLSSWFDAISHDGQEYVVVSDAIQLFSTLDDTLISQIPIQYSGPCDYACTLQDVAFSENDEFMAFSSGVPEVENGIVNLKTGKKLSSIQMGVWGLGFNPEGSIIVSTQGELGYLSRSVVFTDATTGQSIADFKVFGASSPSFTDDGQLVVVSGIDDNAPNPDVASGKLYFFDTDVIKSKTNLDASLAIRTDTFSTWIMAAQFSPHSTYLAIGDKDGNFYLQGLHQ